MFSKLGRFVVITTLVCSGAALGSGASATTEAARARVWDPPVTLSTAGGYPTLADSAVAPNGDMAVVWSVDGDIQVALRPAEGTWGAAETVVVDGGYPQIEYDGRGRLLLAWTAQNPSGRARIKARAYMPDTGWSTTRVVARRDRGPMTVTDLAVNDGGGAVLAWTWLRRGLVSRGSITGAWTTGLVVRKAAPGATWMDVALGDGGLAALTWVRAVRRGDLDSTDLTYLVARQPPGGDWEAPVVLNTLRNFGPPWPGAGGVTVNATGHTTVAWQHRGDQGRWQVRAMRARQGRAWGRVAKLAPLQAWSESSVRVTGNAQGDGLVTYRPAPFGGRLKGVHRPSGGPWSAPTDIAGKGAYICGSDVAMDPSGRAVALWSRARGPGFWGRGAHAALMSRAGRWKAPRRLTTAQTVDGDTRRAAMNHGDVLTVWTRRVGDLDYRIVARTRS